MSYNGGDGVSNANNALTRIFTQSTLSSLLSSKVPPPIYQSVIRRYEIPADGTQSNSDIISEIYCIIRETYRCEYYYKNTLLNKLIINAHRLHTTTALTEVPIAKSKADFIMINGKAVVYEIKTDLDTLDRLETQISDYYKAFDHVCVVAGESKKSELIDRFEGSPIGIYILTAKNTLSKIKEPEEDKSWLNLEEMFRILRKSEYEAVTLQLAGSLPDVPPVRYYAECKRIICSHSVEEVYPLFLNQLKNRNKLESIDYRIIPDGMHFLIYFSKCRDKELTNLRHFLEQKYREEN